MLPNSTTSWLVKRSRCASTLAPICLIQWRWQLKAVVFGAWGRAPWRSSPMALWCHCWRIWSSSLKLRAIASTSFFGKCSHSAMDRVSHFRVTWNLSRRSRKRQQQLRQPLQWWPLRGVVYASHNDGIYNNDDKDDDNYCHQELQHLLDALHNWRSS